MSANLVTTEIKAYVDALSSKQKVQLVADLIDYVWQKIKPDELNLERLFEELEMMGININESPSVNLPDKIIMGAGGVQAPKNPLTHPLTHLLTHPGGGIKIKEGESQ